MFYSYMGYPSTPMSPTHALSRDELGLKDSEISCLSLYQVNYTRTQMIDLGLY